MHQHSHKLPLANITSDLLLSLHCIALHCIASSQLASLSTHVNTPWCLLVVVFPQQTAACAKPDLISRAADALHAICTLFLRFLALAFLPILASNHALTVPE